MGFEGGRPRTDGLYTWVRSVIGVGGIRAKAPGLGARDDVEAAQGLRETCHDMRQPVAGVLALAGAALAEPSLPGGVRVRLEQIVQQAEWLADMIQDWLHAAQPGALNTQGRSDLDHRRDHGG